MKKDLIYRIEKIGIDWERSYNRRLDVYHWKYFEANSYDFVFTHPSEPNAAYIIVDKLHGKTMIQVDFKKLVDIQEVKTSCPQNVKLMLGWVFNMSKEKIDFINNNYKNPYDKDICLINVFDVVPKTTIAELREKYPQLQIPEDDKVL